MFEHNTDRMFWTIAVLILGATLLMISSKAFPKAQESIMTTISQNIETRDNANNKLKESNIQKLYSMEDVLDNPETEHGFRIRYTDNTNYYAAIERFDGNFLNSDSIKFPGYVRNPENHKIYKITRLGLDCHYTDSSWSSGGFANSYNLKGKTLKHIEIPNTVTRIATFAFEGNDLQTVYLPDSVNFVGWNAFANNPNVKVIFKKQVIITPNTAWSRENSIPGSSETHINNG